LRLNGHLKTSDMAQMISSLREIRSSIESLPPEPIAIPPVTINISTVPTGFMLDSESGEARPMGFIEHRPSEATRLLEPPASLPPAALEDAEARWRAELSTRSVDELVEIAQRLGLDVPSQ
jgi:hypothetical protein